MTKDSKLPLAALNGALDKCIRCGECRAVCPVFAVERREKFTARGKVALVAAANRGEAELDEPFYQGLANCLLCMACVDRCANDTPTDEIVVEGRSAFVERKGLPAVQRLVYAGLEGGDRAMRVASAAQKLLFKSLPEESGLRRRFPMPFVDRDQLVPQLAAKPFRKTHPVENTVPNARARVVFFTGCMANYAFTNIAESVVRVLNALGVDVTVPEAQACCGAPMFLSGDRDAALRRARNNLDALADDAGATVVVPCSTCGMMLRTHYPRLLEGGERERAEALAARTMDISEYLVREIGAEAIAARITAPLDRALTYHDPCHLNRGQGVSREPRELVRLATGRPVAEMDRPDRCCGLAGTYSLINRPTSKAIQTAKTEDIAKSGADGVATGCPGCVLQLGDGLRRHHVPGSALHVIEALARAMGLTGQPPKK